MLRGKLDHALDKFRIDAALSQVQNELVVQLLRKTVFLNEFARTNIYPVDDSSRRGIRLQFHFIAGMHVNLHDVERSNVTNIKSKNDNFQN